MKKIRAGCVLIAAFMGFRATLVSIVGTKRATCPHSYKPTYWILLVRTIRTQGTLICLTVTDYEQNNEHDLTINQKGGSMSKVLYRYEIRYTNYDDGETDIMLLELPVIRETERTYFIQRR